MSGGVHPVSSLNDLRVGDRVAVSVVPGHFVPVNDLPRKWGNITEIHPAQNCFRMSPFASKTLQRLLPIGWEVDLSKGKVRGILFNHGYAGTNRYVS